MGKLPNLWLAILYGLVGAGTIAVFVAYFSTRLRDIYFAITTLVFSQIFYVIIFTWTEVTGGENGLRGINIAQINLFGFELNVLDPVNKYYAMLAVVVLALWVFSRILASPFGAVPMGDPKAKAVGGAAVLPEKKLEKDVGNIPPPLMGGGQGEGAEIPSPPVGEGQGEGDLPARLKKKPKAK